MAKQLLHGRYELVRALSQGGMGAIYTAKDTKLANSLCAVKEILEDKQSDEYYQLRFAEEMAALARLDHPSIPRVRDFFRLRGRSYLVMDLIQGLSLEDELAEQGQNPPPKVVRDILQVLDVLEYMHGHEPPLLHRDIKPANLLRDRRSGKIRVVDFGLARSHSDCRHTAVGTMGYCAPEQMSGQAEPRSDLFSVGTTMLHLLTGEPCNLMALALAEKEGLPPLPEGLSEIVGKAIEFKASRRYASAREMAEALDRWLVSYGHRHHLSSACLQRPSTRKIGPPKARMPHVWPISVALAATLALGAGVSLGKKTMPTSAPVAVRQVSSLPHKATSRPRKVKQLRARAAAGSRPGTPGHPVRPGH
ncbi:serine/threonine protein kinase [bacterium]|nr:serine/threonine protein kinase [bacterium]